MSKSTPAGIILSLGSVNADFQVRVDQKLGETTTLLAHDFRRFSGGKAANVAYLAARLGASASVMARTGNDDLQQQALAALREMDIDLRYIKQVAGASTGFSMIAVPPGGKKNIVLATNANDAWEAEDLQEVARWIDEAPDASVLVVDYEVPAFIVKKAIETAHQRGFSIILDPSPTERVDAGLFSKIDFIVPDASETEGLTGIHPDSPEKARKAAQQLLKEGIKTAALIKLEDGGCVLCSAKETLHIPPVSVEVVDTTGAGDAFAGALATALLEKRPLREAALWATAASVAAVTVYGSQPAYPERERLLEFVKKVGTHLTELHES